MRKAENKGSRQCRVTSEASPQALGRVFSLLTLFNLVPSHSNSYTDAQEYQHLDLSFERISDRDFDLLLRKIAQLTETFHVSETRDISREALSSSMA